MDCALAVTPMVTPAMPEAGQLALHWMDAFCTGSCGAHVATTVVLPQVLFDGVKEDGCKVR